MVEVEEQEEEESARSLRRASRAEQMASDISGLYRVFPLIFKILYFAQQIVPIEINPPG